MAAWTLRNAVEEAGKAIGEGVDRIRDYISPKKKKKKKKTKMTGVVQAGSYDKRKRKGYEAMLAEADKDFSKRGK